MANLLHEALSNIVDNDRSPVDVNYVIFTEYEDFKAKSTFMFYDDFYKIADYEYDPNDKKCAGITIVGDGWWLEKTPGFVWHFFSLPKRPRKYSTVAKLPLSIEVKR